MADTKTFTSLTAVMRSLGPTRPKSEQSTPHPWCKVAVKNLSAAEELLDWLEHAGYEERRVIVADDAFVVRWR